MALGGLLQLADLRTVFSYDQWTEIWYRLEGATGNAAVFATLAFAGFAVALHEWTRPGRRYAIYLAILNLALVILSGTRMAIFASAVFAGGPCPRSRRPCAGSSSKQRWLALAGLGLVAVDPRRLLADAARAHVRQHWRDVDLNGREELWPFYWQEFQLSPIFGRGLGAGFVAADDWLPSDLSHYPTMNTFIFWSSAAWSASS